MAAAQVLPHPGVPTTTSTSPYPPPLRSNEGPYLDSTCIGWLRETRLDMPLEEMRNRFQDDGYLLLKQLIPKEDVWKTREAYVSELVLKRRPWLIRPLGSYFNFMKPLHLLKSNTHSRDGIFNDRLNPSEHQGVGGLLPENDAHIKALVEAHHLPEYLALAKHPALRKFVREYMNWQDDVECERTLLRHNVPNSCSTAIHYDKIFLRAGEAEFLTVWVPIGDCAANGGGLLYLEDSTELGKSIENNFSERARVLSPQERVSAYNVHMNSGGTLSQDAASFVKDLGYGKRWLTANYEAGDVVFHNPYIIHASGKNEDKLGRIRLSTDLRFYEKGAAMDERWMQAWRPDDCL